MAFHSIGLELLNNLELPADYFNSTLKKMVDYEKELIYIDPEQVACDTMAAGIVPVETSSVAKFENEVLVVGYKYPRDPDYRVIADLEPAQQVFTWIKDFYTGGQKPFPIVSVSDPVIPHSRYEKRKDTFVIDEYFLSNGFKILKPSVGQHQKFAVDCVEHLPKMCVTLKTNDKQDEELEKTPGYIRTFKHQTYSFFFFEHDFDKQAFWAQCEELKIERHKDKKQKTWMKRLIRKQGLFKYYTRFYKEQYTYSPYVVVATEYNPYSPYAVTDLLDFRLDENGLYYRKKFKNQELTGFFSYFLKRYHSDVWYANIFSENKPYNKSLMSLDIVTNSYKSLDSLFSQRKKLVLMTVPFIVDPFVVHFKYNSAVRSPLRYRNSNIIFDKNLDQSGVHVPYITNTIVMCDSHTVLDNHITFPLKRGINRINVTSVKDIRYTIAGVEKVIVPREYDRYVSALVSSRNRQVISQRQYEREVDCLARFYVVREKCVRGKAKNRAKGLGLMTTIQYHVFREAREGEKFVECERVPYKIFRYPCNRWGSLVSSFLVFTLEEFRFSYEKLRENFRAPPWMHKLKYNPIMEEENLMFGEPIVFSGKDNNANSKDQGGNGSREEKEFEDEIDEYF